MGSTKGDWQIEACERPRVDYVGTCKHSDAEFPGSLVNSSYSLYFQLNVLIVTYMISLLYIVQTQVYSLSEANGTLQNCNDNSLLWHRNSLSHNLSFKTFIFPLGFYFLGLYLESLSMPNPN